MKMIEFMALYRYKCKYKMAFFFLSLEFMIDSGSDVVTMQEEVLKTLDLELLGQIHSKGVHGSKKTNLYKATLRIGTQEMEIEVTVHHLHRLTLFQ